MHDGVQREYLLHVPASYDGSEMVPLVLDFHGYFSEAAEEKLVSGWVAKSDLEGFLLVHPDGVARSWNGGTLCCGSAQAEQVDDVGFARAIVEELTQPACVDRARVYATGLSNGGAMAHRLACEASDMFAATAPSAMSNGTVPCEPERPISVIMYRATADTLVGYEGGGLLAFSSARADLEQWSARNGCEGSPRRHDQLCETYDACADGVEVTLCTVPTRSSDLLGGHVLYDPAQAQGAGQPEVAWAAFERHRLPSPMP
jgi:polyhydroxybutyrate depolymerase